MRCLRWELRETRRLLNELQHVVEPYVRTGHVQEHVLYANDATVHEEAFHNFTYPFVQGITPPQHGGMQVQMPARLRVHHFAPIYWTRETVYGGKTENLTHPEANPCDTGSPIAQLLDVFPPFFARTPNGPN
jgi:hypothetical protein